MANRIRTETLSARLPWDQAARVAEEKRRQSARRGAEAEGAQKTAEMARDLAERARRQGDERAAALLSDAAQALTPPVADMPEGRVRATDEQILDAFRALPESLRAWREDVLQQKAVFERRGEEGLAQGAKQQAFLYQVLRDVVLAVVTQPALEIAAPAEKEEVPAPLRGDGAFEAAVAGLREAFFGPYQERGREPSGAETAFEVAIGRLQEAFYAPRKEAGSAEEKGRLASAHSWWEGVQTELDMAVEGNAIEHQGHVRAALNHALRGGTTADEIALRSGFSPVWIEQFAQGVFVKSEQVRRVEDALRAMGPDAGSAE